MAKALAKGISHHSKQQRRHEMIDEFLAETAQILAQMELEVLRYPRADGSIRDPNVFNGSIHDASEDTSSDSIPSGISDAFSASAGTPGEDMGEDIEGVWGEMEAREEEREQWLEMRGF